MILPEIQLDKIKDKAIVSQIVQLMNIIEQQAKQLATLARELQQLKEENARLKGQPKRPHYQNKQDIHTQPEKSGVSTDISVTNLLGPDSTTEERKKANKDPLEIDEHKQISEEIVCSCGCTKFTILRTFVKIIQGIRLIRHNTAYHGRDKKCIKCGKIYRGHVPAEVAGLGFDQATRALISLFKFDTRMTQPLIHRLFRSLGVQISTGEINTIVMENSRKLHTVYQHLKQVGFKKSQYLQSDATGAKRKDKKTQQIINQYAHIIGNKLVSIFCLTRYYNIPTMKRILTSRGRDKPFVSDDGSPNGESLRIKVKQLCWVHEIRLYKKLFPFFNAYQKLQANILSQWRQFYHLCKSYGQDPSEQKKQEIIQLFEVITSQHTHYDDLNKQLKLTKKKQSRLLAFLNHPYLPIHNNQCEQDLREFVIIRKISGETKSVSGDRCLERHLSVIQTARKQGLNVYQTLQGLLSGTLSPVVLTQNIC